MDQFDRLSALSQETRMRILAIYFTLVLLILPDFLGVYLMMDDVFIAQTLTSWENALFEGVVLAAVFTFGMGIIYGMSAGNRQLQNVVVGIAFALVLFSVSFLAMVSNRCIPTGCSSTKYYISLAVISIITFTAYLLPTLINIRVPLFGLVYVAVAVWQSDLWLFISIREVGIEPTNDHIRGLALLFFSIFWILVFASTAIPKKVPQEY